MARKLDLHIRTYLQEFIDRKELTLTEDERHLIVKCKSKIFFDKGTNYTRVKSYLRNNGFSSNGFGTHARFKDCVEESNLPTVKDVIDEHSLRIKRDEYIDIIADCDEDIDIINDELKVIDDEDQFIRLTEERRCLNYMKKRMGGVLDGLNNFIELKESL